jgi:hypothetical protein
MANLNAYIPSAGAIRGDGFGEHSRGFFASARGSQKQETWHRSCAGCCAVAAGGAESADDSLMVINGLCVRIWTKFGPWLRLS